MTVLGIIGGGQLGMMLAEAASRMPQISEVVVLDPTPGCPASRAGASQITAGFADEPALQELARRADVITYEIESGDSSILAKLEGEARISPPPSTLRTVQDKLLQKRMLQENGIPVAPFSDAPSPEEARESARELGYPVIAKSRRGGYDGRGNYEVPGPDGIEPAFAALEGDIMIEKKIPFSMEVSVVAARGSDGSRASYPAVENVHAGGILRTTFAPARAGPGVAREADELAGRVMDALDGAGVFGIEMFVHGGLLVNEIAPRVHNSGHHTLQSCATSQFEQHLRAVLGMPLGPARIERPTIMHNVIGLPGQDGPYEAREPGGRNIHTKMYGKASCRPGRKMGHANIVAREGQSIGDLAAELERVRAHRFVVPLTKS